MVVTMTTNNLAHDYNISFYSTSTQIIKIQYPQYNSHMKLLKLQSKAPLETFDEHPYTCCIQLYLHLQKTGSLVQTSKINGRTKELHQIVFYRVISSWPILDH